MLIAVTGIQTVQRQYIARQIHVALNGLSNVEIDGYRADFTNDDSYEIYNADGVLVYQPHGVHDLLLDANSTAEYKGPCYYGRQTRLKADAFRDRINMIVAEGDLTHYTQDDDYVIEKMRQMYNDHEHEHDVFFGNISQPTMEKLAAAFGDELIVLNIIRNPSVAFLVDTTYNRNQHTGLNNPHLSYRLGSSISMACDLKPMSSVTTVKYETIIDDGKFQLLGMDIVCPELFGFNQYLTEEENTHIVPTEKEKKAETLELFNQLAQDIRAHSDTPADDNIPNNVFEHLGYEAIDIETIIGS